MGSPTKKFMANVNLPNRNDVSSWIYDPETPIEITQFESRGVTFHRIAIGRVGQTTIALITSELKVIQNLKDSLEDILALALEVEESTDNDPLDLAI